MQKARRRLSAPTACRRTVSGSISLPCPGCFPPFPHGTGSLSVFRSYLALRDGPRCFGQDSSCPALLRKRPKHSPVTRTGLSPSADRLSRRFRFLAVPSRTPLLPRLRLDAGGLGSSPFARHYSGNRFFLSSPAGTKMFQFPAFAPASQPVHGIRPCGLPHSDTHGSLPVCGSPWIFAAYRVLPRFRKPRHPPFALVLFLSRSRVTDPPASCDAKDPLSPVLREIAFPSAHTRSLFAPVGAARLYLFFTSFSLSVLSMNFFL